MEEKNKAIIDRQDYVSSLDGQTHYYCEIILPETMQEGYHWIKFKKPLKLKCHYIGTKDYGYKIAAFSFDFGMDHITPLEKEHNFILMDSDNLSDEEKIVFDVKFDLFHAFFHCEEDPNYSDYHWALYGNLKDRVELGEDTEQLYKDLEEQRKFYESREWIKIGIACDNCGRKDLEVFTVNGKPLIKGIAYCRECNEQFEKGDYTSIFAKVKQNKQNKKEKEIK